MLNPLPDRVVSVIVKVPVPEFVTPIFFLLLEPIATFPKLTFEGGVARLADDTHPDRIMVTNKISRNILITKGLRRAKRSLLSVVWRRALGSRVFI